MHPAVKSKKSCWACLFSFLFIFFIWTAALAKEKTFGFSFLQLKAWVNNCKNSAKSTQVLSLSLSQFFVSHYWPNTRHNTCEYVGLHINIVHYIRIHTQAYLAISNETTGRSFILASYPSVHLSVIWLKNSQHQGQIRAILCCFVLTAVKNVILI